ncbi:MAG: glycosyltransferase 2 family protein [Solirubrobacteraceae bacterium]|nr:glycosyltransferase 2 family protein [Solirubrobacteraceae bacterium]
MLLALACGVCALALWLSPFGGLSSIDVHALSKVRITWSWLVLAGTVNLVSILAKGAVWKASLDAVRIAGRIGWRAVISAMFVGFLLNTVLVARVGELARVAVLKRRLRLQGIDIPFATVAGTVIAEQVVLGLGLVLFLGALVLVVPLPRWATWGLVGVAVLLTVIGIALAAAAWSARRSGRSEARKGSRLARVIDAVMAGHVLFGHPLQAALALAASLVSWISQVLAISLALTAFGIHAGLGPAALVFVTTTLASLFPLVPASIGVFQGAVSVALVSAYGVAPAVALAFSVALQLVEMTFGIGLGLACLAAEGLSLANARALISTERPADAA